MKLKNRKLLGSFNRFRLMLTLGLAVLLPAAALIYVNYRQLRAFERGKVLDAAISRDFQEVLAISDYHGLYKEKLARLHRARPLVADHRLWTARDIALTDSEGFHHAVVAQIAERGHDAQQPLKHRKTGTG